jgi:hypothetical protein
VAGPFGPCCARLHRPFASRVEGQAQAQKLLQSTLTPQIIQLKAVEKWNGVLPQVTGNGAVPLIGDMDTMAKPVAPAAPKG